MIARALKSIFRKLQSNAFVRLQFLKKNHQYKREVCCLLSYIALLNQDGCKQKLFIYFSFFFIIRLEKYIYIFFRGIWEWVSRLLIELQSSSKNQNNPHDQLNGGLDTFQSSQYHSFPLKPVRIKIFKAIKTHCLSFSY